MRVVVTPRACRGARAVAVVGAGHAGSACAIRLRELGVARVDVFDAGRVVGGRHASRSGADGARWDHGASRVEMEATGGGGGGGGAGGGGGGGGGAWTRDARGRGALDAWRGSRVRLDGASGRRRVSEDGVEWTCARGGWDEVSAAWMRDAGARTRSSARVTAVARASDGTLDVRFVRGGGGGERVERGYDVVVLADKNLARVGGVMEALDAEDVARAMRAVESAPALALMVTFNRAPEVSFVGAEVDNDPTLAWIANESSKPGRSPATRCWVAHATEAFAREKVTPEALALRVGTPEHEAWLEQVADEMVASFIRLVRLAEYEAPTATAPLEITYARAHRWGAAFPTSIAPGAEANGGFLRSSVPGAGVYAIGDYCAAPLGTVRAAVVSGLACADAIAGARSRL